MGRRLADLFHGRARLQVGGLLAGPLGWLVILYLGSLVVLLVASFWSVDAAQRRALSQGFSSTTTRAPPAHRRLPALLSATVLSRRS